MSNPRVSETATLVRLLVEANIEFIVVGMSAAVFLGVPATTLDLDIVHRRTTDNIERLQGLLTKIGGLSRKSSITKTASWACRPRRSR